MRNNNQFKNLKEIINESFRCFVNVIDRQTLIKELDKRVKLARYFDGKLAPTHTLDNYRRMLTKVGYLEETDKLGVYKIVKKIPDELSSSELKKLYNESLKEDLVDLRKENFLDYSTEWQYYKGDYEKFEYDVIDKEGNIYLNCYPNGGNFHSFNGDGDVNCSKIDKIRFSENQKLMINPDVFYKKPKRGFVIVGAGTTSQGLATYPLKNFGVKSESIFQIPRKFIKNDIVDDFNETKVDMKTGSIEEAIMSVVRHGKTDITKIYNNMSWPTFSNQPRNRAERRKMEREMKKLQKQKNWNEKLKNIFNQK